jgi:glycosyltransferase involved in cell wall biosynthesis
MAARVVILSAFLSPFRSGAEACVEEVSARLDGRYQIIVVTARLRKDLPKEDRLQGVAVRRVGLGRPIDKYLFPLLGALAVRRLKPDLVHAVLETYAGLALVFCRTLAPKAKRLLTCQSTNTAVLLKPIHHAAQRVTVISTALRDRARTLGIAEVALIPNGIDLPGLKSARERTKKTRGRILFVGRLESMKGVDTLLHACAQRLKRADWDLRIVGEGSQMKELKKLSKDLGLDDRVSFLGRLTGPLLWNEYAEAEVFCGLSRSEALGNVFLEAQAAGCAVVATAVGGIPDIVRHGDTGLLVAPDDPGAAATAIGRLLGDGTVREAMAARGIELAEAYDWDMIAERYAREYDALLKAGPSARPKRR